MSLKSFFAKGVLSTLVVSLFLTYSFTDLASAHQQEKLNESVGKNTEESTFTMNDSELYQEAKDLGMSDDEIIEMDKQIDSILNEEGMTTQVAPAAILGVLGVIAAFGSGVAANYQGGKFVANQVYKRGILSKAKYKKYRWQFRSLLPLHLGYPGALGFDDYYMDI
jgi:hypothetical protein